MNAKHQWKYTYNDTTLEEFSPVEVTFDTPGDVTLTQMLWNFECYLKACGFYFDGHLQFVPEEGYDLKDLGWEDENGLEGTSSPLMDPLDNDIALANEWAKADQKVKEWNKGLEKLQAEVKKNKWVHGMCNPPASDWANTKNNPDNCWNS